MSIDPKEPRRAPDAERSLNIGELFRNGEVLATREVLALVHEVCRQPRACPRGPEDLWLTEGGEVLVARCDRPAEPIDARDVAASLLEAMLPADCSDQLERQVSPSLRGLPARLRSSDRRVGAQDRKDLMSILAWHLAGDPREILQALADRVRHPQPVIASPPETVAPPPRRKAGVNNSLAVVGAALLVGSIGFASYWWFRQNEPRLADSAVETATAPRSPVVDSAATPPPAGRIVVSPPPSTAPVKISSPEGAFSPAFASGGRELFFHAGRASAGRLLVANLDSGGKVASIRAVIEEQARTYHGRVSPDGRLIAFDSDRDGERGVYIAERDGSDPQRVSGSGYAAVPSWSPDMKWLAFIRAERTRPRVWNLWLRDLASGQLRRHTAFRSGQVWGASWFPDGQSFCYSHEDQLIITHLDGRDDLIIESPRLGMLVRTPAVSPDGTRVVFQVFKDGVWLVDLATREIRRIGDDPTAEEFAWAPDGRRIAYHSRRDGAWKIWVTQVGGNAN
jgi:Tol biopolymer transport system component